MIWAFIPGPIKRAVAWLAAGLAALWLARVAGKREARAETALQAAERYAKTRKDMDDAANDLGDDPAVLRDFLHHRNPNKP